MSKPQLLYTLTPLPAGISGWGLVSKRHGRDSFLGSKEKPFVYKHRRVAELAAKVYDYYHNNPAGTTRVSRYHVGFRRYFRCSR